MNCPSVEIKVEKIFDENNINDVLTVVVTGETENIHEIARDILAALATTISGSGRM